MTIYMGLLGDPAKIEYYKKDFFSLLENEESNHCYYLIGASERNVPRRECQTMYNQIIKNHVEKIPKLEIFSKVGGINSRIGIFPSGTSQIFQGPGFAFASYPANSSSKYLKLKSKLLITMLSPFLPLNVIKVVYTPLGGLAAQMTKAETESEEKLVELFQKTRRSKWFDYFYLEAGSGSKVISNALLQTILQAQITDFNSLLKSQVQKSRIVPKAIYGGGINSVKILEKILYPENEKDLIPEHVIIGNISESNLSETKKLISKLYEFNNEYFR